MSVNYTNLFEDIGSLLKAANQFRNAALGTTGSPKPDIPALLADVDSVFSGNSNYAGLQNVQGTFETAKDSMTFIYDTMSSLIEARLMDKTTIIEQLPGLPPGANIRDVLEELVTDMFNNAQTVNRSAVTFGSVTAASGNVGTGLVKGTTLLDGKSIPILGGVSLLKYLGLSSEVSVSETLTFSCTQDSSSDGLPSGEELFLVEGSTAQSSPFSWRTEGSGSQIFLNTLNAAHIVSNQDFELWSTTAMTGWDRDAGTLGTHIIQETTLTDVFRGNYALRLTGDAALAAITLSQTFPTGQIEAGKLYALGVAVKGDATIAAGTLTVKLKGTGYTPGGTEYISMNAAALAAATSYTQKWCFIQIPLTIPDDFEIEISWSGTPPAKSIRLDSLAFGPVAYVDGVGVAIFAGSTAFVRGDRFTVPITNNDAGVFQKYFRQKYRMQLPSSGTPSIADSLAT